MNTRQVAIWLAASVLCGCKMSPDASPKPMANHSETRTQASKCVPDHKATIAETEVESGLVLNGQFNARSMSSSEPFKTNMTVSLCAQMKPEKQCVTADNTRVFDFDGAEMTLSPSGSTLSLNLANTNSSKKDEAIMEAVSDATTGKIAFLRGTSAGTKNKYFVYFNDYEPAAAAHAHDWRKDYRVQLYYSDDQGATYLCDCHMPDHMPTGHGSCASEEGAGQGGLGGGTEPRP